MATYGICQMCLNLARKILYVWLPKILELFSGFSGGILSQVLALGFIWIFVSVVINVIEKALTWGAWLMRKFE